MARVLGHTSIPVTASIVCSARQLEVKQHELTIHTSCKNCLSLCHVVRPSLTPHVLPSSSWLSLPPLVSASESLGWCWWSAHCSDHWCCTGQHQLTHLQHTLTQSTSWTNVVGGDDVLQTKSTGHKRTAGRASYFAQVGKRPSNSSHTKRMQIVCKSPSRIGK